MSKTFRSEYRKLTVQEVSRVEAIKRTAEDLHELMTVPFASGEHAQRQLALGRTNLEQAVMWAVKGITG
jgi:hypothetical protein